MANGGETKPSKRWRNILIVAGACLVVLPMFGRVLYEPFKIPSSAMQPTLHPGDHIFANKIGYDADAIERGHIIVFRYPLDPSEDFIKRVIGLPGDEVLLEDGSLQLQCRGENEPAALERTRVDDPCIDEGGTMAGCTVFEEVLDGHRYRIWVHDSPEPTERRVFQVPEGHLFVLGDNRGRSHDSASWSTRDASGQDVPAPFLPIDLVKGQATRRWLPFGRAGVLE